MLMCFMVWCHCDFRVVQTHRRVAITRWFRFTEPKRLELNAARQFSIFHIIFHSHVMYVLGNELLCEEEWSGHDFLTFFLSFLDRQNRSFSGQNRKQMILEFIRTPIRNFILISYSEWRLDATANRINLISLLFSLVVSIYISIRWRCKICLCDPFERSTQMFRNLQWMYSDSIEKRSSTSQCTDFVSYIRSIFIQIHFKNYHKLKIRIIFRCVEIATK